MTPFGASAAEVEAIVERAIARAQSYASGGGHPAPAANGTPGTIALVVLFGGFIVNLLAVALSILAAAGWLVKPIEQRVTSLDSDVALVRQDAKEQGPHPKSIEAESELRQRVAGNVKQIEGLKELMNAKLVDQQQLIETRFRDLGTANDAQFRAVLERLQQLENRSLVQGQ